MRFFIALVLLAAIALPASAQLPPIIITATRFPDDATRLPASVTVLSAEQIQRSAARTLPEILAEQVGLTMKDFFGNNAASTSVDLRGFGATGAQNTLVLVDGGASATSICRGSTGRPFHSRPSNASKSCAVLARYSTVTALRLV